MTAATTAPRAGFGPAVRSARRSAGGVLSLLAVLVAGGAIALAGVSPPRAQGHHPTPAWTAGPIGSLLHLTSAQFLLVLGVMAAGWIGLLLSARHVAARWILGAVVVLHVLFTLAPPMLSTDIFSYLAYARLDVVHHLDPYATLPVAARHDPVFPLLHWRRTLSAYGPLFTLATYPIARLSPGGALVALKVMAGVASLGCVALVWWLAGRLGRSRREAVTIFGLNPMLLVWTVGGAHNDLPMLLGMLGGLALVVARREVLGGMALVAGAAVKASAGLAAPFLVLGAARRWRALAGLVAGTAIVVAIAWVAFPSHAGGMLGVLAHERHLVAQASLPYVVARLLGHPRVPGWLAALFTAAEVLAVGAALWVAARRRDAITACGWAYVAFAACSTWLLGWYTVWSLPYAALSRDRRLLAATFALQVFFVSNRLHWA